MTAILSLAGLMLIGFQNCAESLDLSSVDGSSNDGSDVGLINLFPTITQSDIEKTFAPNSTMVLNVEAQGEGPLSYQWYKVVNSVETVIAGATTKTLTIANVTNLNAGDYKIRVSNNYGSDERVIKVTIGNTSGLNPPVIITQLQDVNATATRRPFFGNVVYTFNTGNGSDIVTFTVGPSGVNLSYQWYKVGSNGALSLIPGANDLKYSFKLTSLSQAGTYVVFVLNADGAVQSSAKLKIQVLQ